MTRLCQYLDLILISCRYVFYKQGPVCHMISDGLYLDSTCSTVTGQNGTWFRLGNLVKGKNYLLEPSIRKWSIVGNPSKSNVWEMGKELPAMNNYTWHIFFRVLTTTVQAGQDTILKYSHGHKAGKFCVNLITTSNKLCFVGNYGLLF